MQTSMMQWQSEVTPAPGEIVEITHVPGECPTPFEPVARAVPFAVAEAMQPRQWGDDDGRRAGAA